MTLNMKRKYVKPQMEVYIIKGQMQLLQGSPTPLPFDSDPVTPPIPWQW